MKWGPSFDLFIDLQASSKADARALMFGLFYPVVAEHATFMKVHLITNNAKGDGRRQ